MPATTRPLPLPAAPLLAAPFLATPLLAAVLISALAATVAAPAHAADLPRRDLDRDAGRWAGRHGAGLAERSCTLEDITPAYGPIVPTNSLCDPTYVGSADGLSRPSYYGTLQPPAFRALVSPFPPGP